MGPSKRLVGKKATWLAFGLIALSVFSSAQEQNNIHQTALSGVPQVTTDTPADIQIPGDDKSSVVTLSQQEIDQTAEASRAYRQALSTLTTLTAHPPSYTHDPKFGTSNVSNTFLSSFFSYLQGQGPVGSFLRIAFKLYQHSWISRITSRLGKENLVFTGSRKKGDEMRGKAIKVIDLLQHSAELGNMDALYTLAQLSLFPPNTYFPLDPTLAFNSFVTHAEITGNASSQSLLAFFYSTGYRDIVPVDQAKAQLYYTFAGHGGSKGAQMALGYRYWAGIGSLDDCGRALEWYEAASDQAMDNFLSGPPGGRTIPQTATRLSDLSGGVYGPGASVASTGLHAQRPAIKAGLARKAGETWEDVLEYYLFNADRGETDFAYRLGKIFYQGSIYASAGGIASGSEGVGSVPRDFQRARYYFTRIVRQVWPRDPTNPLGYAPAPKDEGNTAVGYAAASAAYLGRMYLRGEGVKADAAMAKMWFERGAEHGDRECHNGLGIIWRDGLVQGKTDIKKSVAYFTAAAGQELAEAQVNLGKYHYYRNELNLASTYFETAIRLGSPFEAYYYLADIQALQAKNPAMPANIAASSCAMAVSFHKLVSERGVWDEDLLREAEVAWNSGTDRGKEVAMLKWWIVAERGSEIGQNNLAFVLDQAADKSILRLTRFSPIEPSNDTAKLALTQWTRSAAQHNVDALVKVGDYYYHGLGVSDDSERLEKAARYYQSAADTQLSALAMWNLGWMYENGVGLPQDFHLAKRHYDLAMETNSEAYLPGILSLIKLHIRSFWHTLMGGKGGLKLWASDEDDAVFSGQKNAEGRELDGRQDDGSSEGGEGDGDEGLSEEEDGPWYMGKARDEFHKRRRGNRETTRPRGQEEDPIEWARERRNAERERDSDFGPEDYFEGAMRGGHRGDDDTDEFRETILLVMLCLGVSVLLYIRTRLVERMRRDQQQDQQAQPQAPEQAPQQQPPLPAPPAEIGLFPPPGDPARDDWAVMR